MAVMFRNTDDLMDRANRSITALNSVMIEYISGMKLIKAYNMGSKSFRKFSSAIHEENAMWNETSRRMGPPYAAFVVIIECGMLLMVPLGGMFFLKGSLTASAFLLFLYVGSMYLTEIRPLQLKNAPILILDEATSASDPENQMEIDRAIQNLCKGKTVIVVAHRLSALKMCERVAVVEDHTITCVGTHEEVRRDNAYYRKAWEDYEKARNITYQLEGGRVE